MLLISTNLCLDKGLAYVHFGCHLGRALCPTLVLPFLDWMQSYLGSCTIFSLYTYLILIGEAWASPKTLGPRVYLVLSRSFSFVLQLLLFGGVLRTYIFLHSFNLASQNTKITDFFSYWYNLIVNSYIKDGHVKVRVTVSI